MKITPWISGDNCSYRLLAGQNDVPQNRVAFIEKTPRIRIRSASLLDPQWPDFLNWADGFKGDGPDDQVSKDWCDNMLKATGFYEL